LPSSAAAIRFEKRWAPSIRPASRSIYNPEWP
jgi:hypothetical protein